MKYIVKPNYNGTDKRIFDDPKEAVDYYQTYVEQVSGKMIGTVEQKLEEFLALLEHQMLVPILLWVYTPYNIEDKKPQEL